MRAHRGRMKSRREVIQNSRHIQHTEGTDYIRPVTIFAFYVPGPPFRSRTCSIFPRFCSRSPAPAYDLQRFPLFMLQVPGSMKRRPVCRKPHFADGMTAVAKTGRARSPARRAFRGAHRSRRASPSRRGAQRVSTTQPQAGRMPSGAAALRRALTGFEGSAERLA